MTVTPSNTVGFHNCPKTTRLEKTKHDRNDWDRISNKQQPFSLLVAWWHKNTFHGRIAEQNCMWRA